MIDDVVALDRRVHDRHLAQGQHGGPREQRHEPEVDAVTRPEPLARARPERLQLADVDLVERRQDGRRPLSLDEPPCDRAAQLAHRHALDVLVG